MTMQPGQLVKLVSPCQLGPAVLAVALLYAGLAKAFRIDLFRDSLETWTLLPEPSKLLVTFLVPAIEVAIAARWLTMGSARRDFVWAPLSMVMVFTVVFAAHYFFTEAPKCACFGKWSSYRDDQVSGLAVILRNTMLIQCGAVGGLLASARWVRVTCDIVLVLALVCGVGASIYAFAL